MDNNVFWDVLARLGATLDTPERMGSRTEPLEDEFRTILDNLPVTKRRELVAFIDKVMASGMGDAAVERLFDDGHLNFVWKARGAARQLLSQIRALASPDSERRL